MRVQSPLGPVALFFPTFSLFQMLSKISQHPDHLRVMFCSPGCRKLYHLSTDGRVRMCPETFSFRSLVPHPLLRPTPLPLTLACPPSCSARVGALATRAVISISTPTSFRLPNPPARRGTWPWPVQRPASSGARAPGRAQRAVGRPVRLTAAVVLVPGAAVAAPPRLLLRHRTQATRRTYRSQSLGGCSATRRGRGTPMRLSRSPSSGCSSCISTSRA